MLSTPKILTVILQPTTFVGEVIRTAAILICVGIIIGFVKMFLNKPIKGLPKNFQKAVNKGFD